MGKQKGSVLEEGLIDAESVSFEQQLESLHQIWKSKYGAKGKVLK